MSQYWHSARSVGRLIWRLSSDEVSPRRIRRNRRLHIWRCEPSADQMRVTTSRRCGAKRKLFPDVDASCQVPSAILPPSTRDAQLRLGQRGADLVGGALSSGQPRKTCGGSRHKSGTQPGRDRHSSRRPDTVRVGVLRWISPATPKASLADEHRQQPRPDRRRRDPGGDRRRHRHQPLSPRYVAHRQRCGSTASEHGHADDAGHHQRCSADQAADARPCGATAGRPDQAPVVERDGGDDGRRSPVSPVNSPDLGPTRLRTMHRYDIQRADRRCADPADILTAPRPA